MDTLKFKRDDVIAVINALKAVPDDVKPAQLYGTTVERGFFLVGDQGVYLMQNAGYVPGQSPLAYAEGCNPKTDDDFYDNKVELFGGDDGVEFIPEGVLVGFELSNVEAMWIDMADESINISFIKAV